MWPFVFSHLEEQPLADQYRWDVSFDDPANLPVTKAQLKILQCPSVAPNRFVGDVNGALNSPGGELACGDYGPIAISPILADKGYIDPVDNFDGALPVNAMVSLAEITDGTSNTILLVEHAGGGAWASASNLVTVSSSAERGVHGLHTGGGNVVFVDGSVHFLKATLDLRVLARLVTRAGGETVESNDF
jgi:prepilin-type processing-associated H-X9-DG protein